MKGASRTPDCLLSSPPSAFSAWYLAVLVDLSGSPRSPEGSDFCQQLPVNKMRFFMKLKLPPHQDCDSLHLPGHHLPVQPASLPERHHS